MMLADAYNRPLKDLRISVTDRCNFRCTYCMPLDEYEWIDKKEILTFEEIARLANVFVDLGVEKIRLTGGEPLVPPTLGYTLHYTHLPAHETKANSPFPLLLETKHTSLQTTHMIVVSHTKPPSS